MSGRLGAVVLAGGRSSRFGGDKLAVQLDDRSLLDHALAAVRAVDPGIEIVVAGAPGSERPMPADVRVVADARAFEGPMAGVSSGLRALDRAVEVVLVVGGDMPWLVPAVLRRMVEALVADPTLDAVALDDDGRTRPLPLAMRRLPGEAAVGALLDADDRRLRSLMARLRTVVLFGDDWRTLDPAGSTIRDVDAPADLADHPGPRIEHRRRP